MTYDFSGYATKFDIECSDGRTIRREAFQDMDGETVPLVWQHGHDAPENVLGHASLEVRDDGVYCYVTCNGTDRGQHAKEMVRHKDISALSIYANRLQQRGGDVVHGVIREVSLVLSGANPGALIDNVSIKHGSEYSELADEAVIYSGEELPTGNEASHSDDSSEGKVKMGSDSDETNTDSDAQGDKTIAEIYESMTEEQKNVLQYMVEQALLSKDAPDDSADDEATTPEGDTAQHSDLEGSDMSRNVFENDANTKTEEKHLSHADVSTVLSAAQKMGSLKDAVMAHADTYGIKDINLLFPDAKMIGNTPDWIKRRTEWVDTVLNGTTHTPFSRIKSMQADITADEARAKGYITGRRKKEEVFTLLKRTTSPTTIYKKQKLDRDDIKDITDFDVVVWLKGEMRLMLEEEIARAVLVGDGRPVDDEDKINEENIRPIWKEDPLYAPRVQVTPKADGNLYDTLVDACVRARMQYEGTGNPTLFTSTGVVTEMLLLRDGQGKRLYTTEQDLKAALRVDDIVEVPVMEGLMDENNLHLLGILVNLRDYSIGADRGGQTDMFEDFDIDYNQHKYLLETRMSGALTKVKSAVILETSANLTTKNPPAGQAN